MEIVSRASWGAAPPRRTPYKPGYTDEVFLHHSAGAHSGAAGMRSMQAYHQSADPSRNKVPWNDIAYNHVIDPVTLTVYEGRGWGVAPGAQKGHNTGTWACCVMGDFRSRQPTQGLLDLIAELIRFGHESGHLPLVLTGGHRDAPGQSTTCPGQNLHSKIQTIRQLLVHEEDVLTPEQEAKLDRVLEIVGRVPSTIDDPFRGDRPQFGTFIRRIYLNAREAFLTSRQTLGIVEEFAKHSGLSEATIARIAKESGEAAADELRDRLGG